MKIKWDDLIAAFAVGVIIGFLLGYSFAEPNYPSFSSPSSEASPALAARAGSGFFDDKARFRAMSFGGSGNSFRNWSSGVSWSKNQARTSPKKALPAPFASRNVEPKRQITETQRWVRSGRRAILPSQNCKVRKQQSRLGLFENNAGEAILDNSQVSTILEHFRAVVEINTKVIEQLTARIKQLEKEIIISAANRNGCYGDDYLILLAIRKAENGGQGKEFGVEGKAWGTDLDTQAGWAAATVVKNRARWNEAGRPPDFISFLGDRYVPKEDDPEGNINFKKNVRFWFRRFKNENRNNRQIKSGLFG